MKGLFLVARALVLGPARHHPLRAVLPAFGVAIGVAAVAAIHYANRSVTLSFRDAAASISGRSDFVVTGVAGVPVDALPSLAFLWRYGAFAPSVSASAVVDDGSGEIAQILGIDPGGDMAVREMKVVGDLRPAFLARGSVFVSEPFARRHGLSVGSRLSLIAGGIRRSVAIAGLLELSGVARAAGGDLVVTDIFTAQRLLGRPGLVDRVDIVLDAGADRERVAGMIRANLMAGLTLQPPGRSAVTADRMVRAFRFNLNALGSLTLFVGIFSIANAVSISVLRRRPEIATLKAVGASRGVLFAVFVAEGLAIGAAGTLVGEIGGLYLARFALRSVARTISDIYLPTTRIAGAGYFSAAAIAAAVGMASALAATLLPAAEATRVAPSPALRAGSIESIRKSRLAVRTAAAGALLLAAAGASLAGPIRGFPFFGFLAVAGVVAALALAAPAAVALAARAAKGPLTRLFGASGRLAAGFFGGSLARNGVAVAALALALGMTLAMITTVSSIRETVRVWVESTLRSDLFVKAAAGRSKGFVGDLPEDVVGFLRSIPGVAVVDPLRVRDVTDESGRPYSVGSGDFAAVASIGGLPFMDRGDPAAILLAAREKGDALVSEPFARRFSAFSGSVITLVTPRGPRRFRVAAVYRDYSNDRGTVMIDRGLYLFLFRDSRVTSAAVLAAPGADVEDLRRRILAASQGRYALSVSSNRDLRRAALKIFEQTFSVTRALESIAVLVAILGVANALLASAVERRRSFGLLRALGAASGQIRATLLLEAGLSGVTAAIAAVCAAAAFTVLLLEVINPQSFGWTVVLNVPVLRLAAAGGLVLAAAIGAGIFPGRVAASVDPAAALAEE